MNRSPLNVCLFCRKSLTCCSLARFLTHEWCVYHWLNGFKLTGIVYYNRSSLIILVNDTRYILYHINLPTQFSTPRTSFPYCKYKPSIKIIHPSIHPLNLTYLVTNFKFDKPRNHKFALYRLEGNDKLLSTFLHILVTLMHLRNRTK